MEENPSRKLVIIGDGCCGKTSMLLAYLSNEKKCMVKPDPTILDTCLIKIELNQSTVNKIETRSNFFLFPIRESNSFFSTFLCVVFWKTRPISWYGTRRVKKNTKNCVHSPTKILTLL